MLNKALEAFGDLGDDEELGPADWPTVKRYITCLNDLEGERVHPHSSSENDDTLHHMNLKDIRIRFLNGKNLSSFSFKILNIRKFRFHQPDLLLSFIINICMLK